MKLLKKVFYVLAFLIIALCGAIVFFAFNPTATEGLKETLYGDDGLVEDVAGVIGTLKPSDDSLSGDEFTPVIGPATGILVGTQEGVNWDTIPGINYEMTGTGLTIPNAVLGLSGLEAVQSDSTRIDDAEKNLLADGLSYGELGENYDFISLYYPYYNMLTGDMKKLYNQIFANLKEINGKIAPIVPVHTSQLKTVFEAVFADHPELFHAQTGYTCKYTGDGNVVEIGFKYNETASFYDQAHRQLMAAADEIISQTRKVSALEDIEKMVHDMLAEKVEYNLHADMNQSAYSALVNHSSVCAGISRAFQYVMQRMGYACYYCAGYSDGDHAWNIMKLGDTYRNVDLTWDDQNPISYDYYNKTDSQFKSSHARTGLSVYLPACVADKDTEPTGEPEPPKMKPLIYVKNDGPESLLTPEELEHLAVAGLEPEAVCFELGKYFETCKELMKQAGKGSHTFEVVVPVALYNSIEAAYMNDVYKKEYVTDTLKALGADNFAIQIQLGRTNGGYYYRLYHNIAVWSD